jgi:hypothetical protein
MDAFTAAGAPAWVLGRTTDDATLRIDNGGERVIDVSLGKLAGAWRSALTGVWPL